VRVIVINHWTTPLTNDHVKRVAQTLLAPIAHLAEAAAAPAGGSGAA
jgi:dUTPase